MKMKKKSSIFIVFIMIVVVFGCNNRISNDNAINKVNLANLLISVNDMPMPAQWSSPFGPGLALEPNRSTDSIGIGFYSDLYPESLGVSQEIYRFTSTWKAKWDYSELLRGYDTNSIPSEWTFQSEFADESFFLCEDASNIPFPHCEWYARYERLVVQFGGWLIPERMTLFDMEEIARTIDTKVGKITLGE